MRRSLTGGVATAAGIGAVVVGLAVIDDRVRAQLTALVTGRGSTGEIGSLTAHTQALAYTMVLVVRDQSIEHAPLAIFALAALVLVLFMLRT
jgi:hypothetical protein